MSDITQASSVWSVLLPVIGGAIAVVGGFAAQLFLQRLKDATEKRQKRAEKFEELVGAVTEHYHAIGALRFFAISGLGVGLPTLSSLAKIEAIAITYFPEFEDLVRQFYSASNEYEIWIMSTGQKRIASEPGYEKLVGHDEVLTKYTYVRKLFLAELKRFAGREFQ